MPAHVHESDRFDQAARLVTGMATDPLGTPIRRLLDIRAHNAEQREQVRFCAVIAHAVQAIHDGNPDLAAAEIAAHFEDDGFRARMWTSANRMRETVPVGEALRPIGLLVAAYEGRRVDPLYRSALGMLCDADGETLKGLEEILRALTATSWGYGYFNVAWTSEGQPPVQRYYLEFAGDVRRQRIPLISRGCIFAASALVEHQLGSEGQVDPGFGSSDELVGFTGVDGRVFALLQKVFGLAPRKK